MSVGISRGSGKDPRDECSRAMFCVRRGDHHQREQRSAVRLRDGLFDGGDEAISDRQRGGYRTDDLVCEHACHHSGGSGAKSAKRCGYFHAGSSDHARGCNSSNPAVTDAECAKRTYGARPDALGGAHAPGSCV
jgi:hypothetical protein